MELINIIILLTFLATMVNAGLFTNSITLGITLATVASAKPLAFTYAGVKKRTGNSCDPTLVCYSVTDTTGDRGGYFYGCIDTGSTRLLGDGVFTLDLCLDGTPCDVLLTEYRTGIKLQAFQQLLVPDHTNNGEWAGSDAFYGYSGDMNEEVWKNPTCKGIISHP